MKKLFTGCLTAIGAVVVLGILIGIFASGGDTSNTAEGGADQTKQENLANNDAMKQDKESTIKKAGIGETATVANVGFTVNHVKTTSEIDSGNEFIENAKTSGKYVVLDVAIKNGQKEPLMIDSSYFQIMSSDGTTYDPVTDGQVMMAMGENGTDFFLQQINPGLSKSGKVVFEVPKELNLKGSVLHCQTGFFGTESIEINLN
ncbi:DUF4352 domain-containing protein [Virgibacillus siamensis]|uniref:DUF4352 domain-containing protein n=1 Tax=Virgibacillus siamensis TaxID=480071 RepID=UPI0009848EB5|nr:DUF4352 domain-containing protein [Virgibacillus siamensis]